MRPIIIYYTRTGNNQKLCRELQQALGCEIERIIDTAERGGGWNFILSGRDAMFKKLTAIKPAQKILSTFDLVIVGTPFWVGSLPPATRTFLKENKDKLKRIAVISVSRMGEKNGNALPALESESGKKVSPHLFLNEKEFKKGAYKSKLDDFTKSIQCLQKVKGDLMNP